MAPKTHPYKLRLHKTNVKYSQTIILPPGRMHTVTTTNFKKICDVAGVPRAQNAEQFKYAITRAKSVAKLHSLPRMSPDAINNLEAWIVYIDDLARVFEKEHVCDRKEDALQSLQATAEETLRDSIAMRAMAAQIQLIGPLGGSVLSVDKDKIAIESYQYADAMLKERA